VSGHPAHILFDDVTGPVEADFKPVSASWGPLNLDEHLRLVFQERKRDVWQPSNRDVWPRDQRALLKQPRGSALVLERIARIVNVQLIELRHRDVVSAESGTLLVP